MADNSEQSMSPNNNVRQYEQYFDSGTYDRRYPSPNPRVMSFLGEFVSSDSVVLDYGCGSGRYLLPLGQQVRLAIGFDICTAALNSANDRISKPVAHRYRLIGPEMERLAEAVNRHGPVDLALCLFGVLAHVDSPENRRELLTKLRTSLCPDRGRLIISVPNRLRRFREEQRQFAGKDQITYVRDTETGPLELTYRLYDPSSLQQELEAAGFLVDFVVAESVLPESLVSRYPTLGCLDQFLSRLVPARLGYGLLAVARPVQPETGEI
ncbi:class I SAM-dependent methyltransferase [Marinobacter bryozoorum]|uniref:class I SAM-dependent methyltransferase n=1 Tax=Marinobacter bryozoorum TaxID=256324 RepID=UPI0020046598|nr:class I SAM-dependent methyltransferase [Marinobacter bryozoorum]MCK7543145.1 class I SAM-dependent methyltransferase [Marinobacter bryozoorum]